MSSIVKANLLTILPPKVENTMEHPKQAPEMVKEEPQPEEDAGGMIERQEDLLSRAVRKSQVIEIEAQKRADAIIDGAMKASREIMDEAEKKGYEEGYLRGLVDGATASENAAEDGILELRRLIECFQAEQKAALEREEKDLIEIAFELAKKIMRQHVHVDENAVQKMLEEIIMDNEGSLKIYLSEYQSTLDIHIDKSIAKKIKNLAKDSKIVIIKDEDLIMGENEGGIIDFSVPMQLEQLKKAVDHVS